MGDETQLANLLLRMQHSIRGDIRDAKEDLSQRIDDVRAKQGEHDGRLTKLEKQTEGSGPFDLTARQKKVLWTVAAALGAAAIESLSHLFRWIPSVVSAFTKHVPQ